MGAAAYCVCCSEKFLANHQWATVLELAVVSIGCKYCCELPLTDGPANAQGTRFEPCRVVWVLPAVARIKGRQWGRDPAW